MIFTRRKSIRFAHCDAAGIAFYPRYAELGNEVVEDWFAEALGVSFHEFHTTLRLGLPVVRLEIDYLLPSTYGDVLEFSLQVKEIGNSSMVLALVARSGQQERVRYLLKVVMISMETMRAVRIDGDWRPRFQAYMGEPRPNASPSAASTHDS